MMISTTNSAPTKRVGSNAEPGAATATAAAAWQDNTTTLTLNTTRKACTPLTRYQLRTHRCAYRMAAVAAASSGVVSSAADSVHTELMFTCGVLENQRRIRS